MRPRFWSTEPGSNGGAPNLVAAWRAALARPGCSVGRAVSRPLVDRARHRRPVGPRRRLGGGSPSGSRAGRAVGWSLLGCLRRVGGWASGAASDSGSLARSGSCQGRTGPDPRRRGAPVPGTPVRACVGLRTRAGSASSRFPMSCRTSCCRPSRGRTAGRRPRRSWLSRGSPCAGRAACPLPVGRARRMTAGGCPTARSSRRRPVASAFVGGASHMPAGSRLPAPRPPATASADRRNRVVLLVRPVRRRRVARTRPGSRGSAQVRWPPESGWCCFASRRYARLTSSSEALRGNPRTWYGSCTCATAGCRSASATQLADQGKLELGDRFGTEPAVRVT